MYFRLKGCPRCILICYYAAVPPEELAVQPNTSLTEGQTAQFSCQMSGFDTPHVTWYHNKTRVSDKSWPQLKANFSRLQCWPKSAGSQFIWTVHVWGGVGGYSGACCFVSACTPFTHHPRSCMCVFNNRSNHWDIEKAVQKNWLSHKRDKKHIMLTLSTKNLKNHNYSELTNMSKTLKVPYFPEHKQHCSMSRTQVLLTKQRHVPSLSLLIWSS